MSFAFAILTAHSQSVAAAESLLYDNTHHPWSSNRNLPNTVLWTGPSDAGDWFDAQPFKLGGHDNVSSVSIRMARNLGRTAEGTIRVSIWGANAQGLPGEEVGELGLLDISELARFDFPGNQGGPTPPLLLPEVTFDGPIDDLVPGEKYFVVKDYRGIAPFRFGDILAGLSNSANGTNQAGGAIATVTNAVPPFENSEWFNLAQVFGPNQYSQMRVMSDGEPYGVIPCTVGDVYRQDFDNVLGDNGETNVALPAGWAFYDEGSDHGYIFNTFITEGFPAASRLPGGISLYNAGAPSDRDRTLAVGVPQSAGEATIQLVAGVVGDDAKSIRLAFDVEAWDAANSRDNPGEAAFNVALDLDTGDGFSQIMDLGQVSTGATLVPSAEDFVNGNDDAYRTSFDSGLLNVDLPEGSKLRVRWRADLEAETRGWVFGLDNVSLGMFSDIELLGDFNGNGTLDAGDVDLLAAEVRTGTGNLDFDMNGDSQLDIDDHDQWVHASSIANTYLGDSNLDGVFDTSDMITAFSSGQYEDAIDGNSTWSTGDWNGDGDFNSGDMIEAFGAGGYEAGPRAAVAAVPEPSSALLTLVGLFLSAPFAPSALKRKCRDR